MLSFSGLISTALAFAFHISASLAVSDNKYSTVEQNGTEYHSFEDPKTGAKLKYVVNSGICEKTPGVNQYSGYLTVGSNMSMWFWFFEARQDPLNAPLVTWLDGGPGESSMISLFQGNGPCKFDLIPANLIPINNSYSYSNYANTLYIDQPIGTGFSYGTINTTSSEMAASYVWTFLQTFYEAFPTYAGRDFGIFTTGYGGRYGPELAKYIQDQNKAKARKKINLVALGINNPWVDPTIQDKALLEFSHSNKYRELLSMADYRFYSDEYDKKIKHYQQKCSDTDEDVWCFNAWLAFQDSIISPIRRSKDFNSFDIRSPKNDPEPPDKYIAYLQNPAIVKAIGAQAHYEEYKYEPWMKLRNSGDLRRSTLDTLSSVVSTNLTTLIIAADADWLYNCLGAREVAEAINYSGSAAFKSKKLTSYTVNGKEGGAFKTQDNLSFLEVFEAGRQFEYYQPALALQVFIQTMKQTPITPT